MHCIALKGGDVSKTFAVISAWVSDFDASYSPNNMVIQVIFFSPD
jgi:hypothetical protein